METREQAILKLHADLAHEGAAADCVKCSNLATTLGWVEYWRPAYVGQDISIPQCLCNGVGCVVCCGPS